ncbi:glycoside hydrolase family 3 N-terminal domain-containing protein [Schleiferilactobacillus harbinensis]|uniref:glycoside hydrolase family 3 N-terminal domain-containing protein n=1 Tax=Schleiferilactobacillus harbinensis TaxID=304207 RepID=UPI0021A49B24|nr:glycoside hydrolase family 3 N-terminal domain-containing protein [Schleiferilactobacillus harbinensis]
MRWLFNDLSLDEKIGQLVLLTGKYFESTHVSTGPEDDVGITSQTVALAGAALHVIGAKETNRVQQEHTAAHPHHIPLLFVADVINGFRTALPIPLGLGATWDPELVQHAYALLGHAARRAGIHLTFAPMVDLVRDARWGRVLESPGEDPLLNSAFSRAIVQGFQTQLDLGYGIATCVKHFAAYGAAEAGREYNSADMSVANLFQNYLPPYKAAVDAGAKMVMTSLTTLNGVPATADRFMIQNVLRDQWGFKGLVVSDYASITELVTHGYVDDDAAAAQAAITAGIDLDLQSPAYANHLKKLVETNSADPKLVNQACWRMLLLKNELGLFESAAMLPLRPFTINEGNLEDEGQPIDDEFIDRKVAQESLVLLKNDNNLLPLSPKSVGTVALIGPYVTSKELSGLWAVYADNSRTITLANGVAQCLGPNNTLVYSGGDLLHDRKALVDLGLSNKEISEQLSTDAAQEEAIQSAVNAAQKASIVILALGEHPKQSAEGGARTVLRLPDNQMELLNAVKATGKPVVVVIFSGRPLVLTEVVKNADAVLQVWFPGTQGGLAIANVLFGRVNPSGRLSMSLPFTEGQLPVYYNHLMTGRPEKTGDLVDRDTSRYVDSPAAPLFPFGYGLSYGSVRYSPVEINRETVNPPVESLVATVKVTNTGDVARDEVVQFYLRDLAASIVQPVKRLIGFRRVHLDPGQTVAVHQSVALRDLAFYDNRGRQLIEPGWFELWAGPNSQTQNSKRFELVATESWYLTAKEGE